MSSFANILSNSCGLMGFKVVGSNGGGKGSGRSAWMLYHSLGISSGFSCVKLSLIFKCIEMSSYVYFCSFMHCNILKITRTYLYFTAQKST